MVDNENKFHLIDTGTPSELERHKEALMKLPKEMRAKMANNTLKRLEELSKYPKLLGMTEEEIREMNEKAGVSEEAYQKALEKALNTCRQIKGTN